MNKWSGKVTKESHALSLEKGVFTWGDARKIAASLKKSVEQRTARKAGSYQSAVNMLVFYINRAGKNLPKERKIILEHAKIELKKLYDGKD